jgi:hypothetical protein
LSSPSDKAGNPTKEISLLGSLKIAAGDDDRDILRRANRGHGARLLRCRANPLRPSVAPGNRVPEPRAQLLGRHPAVLEQPALDFVLADLRLPADAAMIQETRHALVLKTIIGDLPELRGFWAPSDSGEDREPRKDLPNLVKIAKHAFDLAPQASHSEMRPEQERSLLRSGGVRIGRSLFAKVPRLSNLSNLDSRTQRQKASSSCRFYQ